MTHDPTSPIDPAGAGTDGGRGPLGAGERHREITRSEWVGGLTLIAVVFGWQLATAWPWSVPAMLSVTVATTFYIVPILLLYAMWRHDGRLTRREAAQRNDLYRARLEPDACLQCGGSLRGQPRSGDCPACGARFHRVLVSRRGDPQGATVAGP